MMWSEVEVQWFGAYAPMLDELVGHTMTGSPHRGGDVYGHETRQADSKNRHARGEVGIDECTRPREVNSSLEALLK